MGPVGHSDYNLIWIKIMYPVDKQVYQANYPVGQVLLWFYYQLHHETSILSYVNIYGLLLSFYGHFYGQVYRNQELNC